MSINIYRAFDYYEIGKLAYYEKDYYHAAIWLDEALALYENEKPNSLIIKKARK